jgi:hypothetical protein
MNLLYRDEKECLFGGALFLLLVRYQLKTDPESAESAFNTIS